MILADLVDLAVRRFKHGGNLGDLRCLWELGELIGGHSQDGAWGLVDVMAFNTKKIHRRGCGGVGVAFLASQAEPWPLQGQPRLLGAMDG